MTKLNFKHNTQKKIEYLHLKEQKENVLRKKEKKILLIHKVLFLQNILFVVDWGGDKNERTVFVIKIQTVNKNNTDLEFQHRLYNGIIGGLCGNKGGNSSGHFG